MVNRPNEHAMKSNDHAWNLVVAIQLNDFKRNFGVHLLPINFIMTNHKVKISYNEQILRINI